MSNLKDHNAGMPHSCCPNPNHSSTSANGISRRKFIKVAGGSALTITALSGLSWAALSNSGYDEKTGLVRRALKVKPVLVYSTPEPVYQSCGRLDEYI